MYTEAAVYLIYKLTNMFVGYHDIQKFHVGTVQLQYVTLKLKNGTVPVHYKLHDLRQNISYKITELQDFVLRPVF